jgi:pseudaminic acid cytidylyltransferase
MVNVAIIPARGGSKRIPRKNVGIIGDKPAIAYPIALALNSGLFERVIVSTEDHEIASIAVKYGAEVPFIRSAVLSDDNSTTIDVISDAVQRLRLAEADQVCSIYPVTPLLRIERLLEAYELLKDSSWDYVFPACEYTTPIERAFRKDNVGQVHSLTPKFINTRTQDLEKSFFDAGQFYFGKAKSWEKKLSILDGNSTFIQLARHEVFDVDELADWDYLKKIVELELGK